LVQRALLIGSGSIGQRHLGVLRATLPHALITLLRRPNPPELDRAIAAEVDRVVSDIDAALDPRPDLAVIASPAPTHLGFARRLAEAGIPMLIEKPLSTDLDGCAELEAACRQRRLPVLIGYTLRYHPAFQAFAAQIARGVIGRPFSLRAEVGQYLPGWRPGTDYRHSVTAQRALGGGALLELSHEIDLVRSLLGIPVSIQAQLERLGDLDIDVEDTVELVTRHRLDGDHHAHASIHLDLLQRPARRRMVVSGSEATLDLDFISGRLQLMQDGASTDIPYPEITDRNTLYTAELDDLLQAMRTGKEVQVGLADGIATLRIIDAARRSAAAGQPVAISEAA
jgi:predicted dehydrogenase